MGDRPWWGAALQWAAWGLLMALVMGWLARGRTAVTTAAEDAMVQPRSMLLLGWACTLLFAAGTVLSAALPGEDAELWPTLIFAFFAVLSAFVVADYYRGRHQLTDDGLRYGKVLGRGGSARWDQVVRLRYSQLAKWFRMDMRDGRVVRLSVMLQGLPRFAKEALRHVPTEAIDEDARELLEATARGQPPSIWQ